MSLLKTLRWAAKAARAIVGARRASQNLSVFGASASARIGTRLLPTFDFLLAPLVTTAALLILVMEWRRPLRKRLLQNGDGARRVLGNALFALPAVGAARTLMLPLPLVVASGCEARRVGLLNLLPLPKSWKVALGVLVLDWAYYWWHRFTHVVPLLWRFHNVHHCDLDMDVSTAARFHVLDVGFSSAYRAAIVALFGVPAASVLAFEALFNTAVTFHHSNWRLPLGTERQLARFLVTPRLHGIHHSIVRDECNSNWSNILSCWDKLHGTYRDDVAQDDVTIGVPAHRDADELSVRDLFLLPFRAQRAWQLPDGSVPERKN